MPKSSLKKNSCGAIKPISDGDKIVHTFHKGINLKINMII